MPAKVLAIETSTATGSVAVVCGDEVLYERSFGSKRSHNSELFVPLGEALEITAGVFDLIVVGTGPGSYTGARIGIAAAQGLGLARKVPVIGMSSLVAPQGDGLPAAFVVCGDARRGLYYIATIQDGGLVGEIEQVESAEFLSIREQRQDVAWFTYDDQVPLNAAGVTVVKPSAVVLGRLAARLSDDEVSRCAAELVQPVYLSAPFITPAKPKK